MAKQTLKLTITPEEPVPVFRLTDGVESPRNLNYDILGLHKRRTFIKGELQRTDYFKQFNIQTNEYDQLCVSEFNEYYRQAGFVYLRVKLIEWYMTDDSVGETKTTEKYYELSESMQEGVQRRNNIVYQAAEKLVFKIGVANLADLQNHFREYIQNYERGVEQPFIDAVAASDKAYLDYPFADGKTVREYLVEELKIVYV